MVDRRVIVEHELDPDAPAPVEQEEETVWVEEPVERVVVDLSPGVMRRVGPTRVLATIRSIVDFAFFLIYTLLGVRLVLELVAARPGAGFTTWIRNLSEPLYVPFRGILPSIVAEGGYTLVLPLVVALIAYGLLHWAIRRLLRTIAYGRTTV